MRKSKLLEVRSTYPCRRPFKSPLYPVPQLFGIIGMGYMLVHNSPSPEMTGQVYFNAGILILIMATYAFFWVKFRMKKRLFEAEPMEKALTE